MPRRLLLLVLFPLLAAPAAAARFTTRIVNGLLTHDYPTTGALLVGNDPRTAVLQCSGTLVGCETFVTAAHCVCPTNGPDCQGAGAPDPDDYLVFLQHAGFVEVASVAVHPDFDFPVADLAVLKLAAPVAGIRPTPINTTAALAPGTPGTIAGFGRIGGGDFTYGLKRRGGVETAPCGDGLSDTTSVCWDFLEPLGAPGDDSNTCNGDSGGPLLVDFGCGPVLAGVTSGGDSATCLADDHSYDVNVHHYRTWLATQAGSDLGAPSCGAMPQVGEAGAHVSAFAGSLGGLTTQAVHSFTVAPGTTTLRVALNSVDDGGSDFDLYLRHGSPPTVLAHDCKADGQAPYGYCEIPAPAAGTWYVLVNAAAGAGLYQVTATAFDPGAPGPTTDGTPCDDGNACTTGDVCAAGNCASVPETDGTPCDDGRLCTGPDTCQAGTCTGAPAPLATCQAGAAPKAGSLTVRDHVNDPRDDLVWKWTRGTAVAPGGFGDPTAGTEYELCVFDADGGSDELLLDIVVPAGARWKPYARGYRYRDPAASVAGVRAVVLRTGDAGRSQIVLKARGEQLPTPDLPLVQDPRVVVQLIRRDTNACFESRYSTNTRNTGDRFTARPD